ncbi:MAG: 50S ribosomal protein L25/general stress protein Ctc [Methylococcales symbiont of Iophon sp. n. MRB-2018]|nr:MAG: 50S ribosomal protein L25/general stress protein Ctc [Methylococcales symbiont of Iophon sp. n. MRB-2018]KAF3978859.1 MAG: 50S ribosomal protein L25/general stress protein Ctc [Methylococcales symbiont of Iophon sp. n. MRB-2018]
MSSVFEFVAEKRDLSGKAAARATRREGKLPAIVYGRAAAPQSIVLDYNDVSKHLEHEAVYSHVLDLKIDGKTEKAVLKGVQRHPAKAQILHLDFMRIDESQALKAKVPLHFTNEDICVGVKMGGVVTHAMVDIEVSCLPSALPEYIEVDLTDMELGSSIHLTDIKIPEGVTVIALAQEGDHDHTVAQVMKVREPRDDDDEEVESVAGEEEAEEE